MTQQPPDPWSDELREYQSGKEDSVEMVEILISWGLIVLAVFAVMVYVLDQLGVIAP